MTYHFRSVVEFGQLFNKISETVLKGAPLRTSLELIRAQFDARAALLSIETRTHGGTASYEIADRDEHLTDRRTPETCQPGSAQVQHLHGLSEQCQVMKASCSGINDLTRYTLSVFADRGDPEFGQEEIDLCEVLVAHVAQGREIMLRMSNSEVDRMLYSDVMDKLYVGVVILDAAGRVTRVSASAQQLLAAHDGLKMHGNRLRASCSNEDRQLQATIKAVLLGARDGAANTSRGLSLTGDSSNRRMGVIVRAIAENAQQVSGNSAVAVYIRDADVNPEVQGELLRQLFDLTPAEAALAGRLTAGLSLDDAASSLHITRNTARAHLRSIFSKSGITRQMELVRLVLNSAVILGERCDQYAR